MFRWLSCAGFLLVSALMAAASSAQSDPAALYLFQPESEPRWISPENPKGEKGAGGAENRGAKGHAFETIGAGQTHVLADIKGAGTIDRMWMTIFDRSPEQLRRLKFEIYWDGAKTPAVAAPLGDFFGHGSGQIVPMENALFASPEGRSFVSYAPMPFRTSARIQVTNESDREVPLFFFDVDYRKLRGQAEDMLYFHAWWSRERATTPGEAHRLLPLVQGRGRFLGTSVTVFTDPAYGKTWWGEGAVRIALDGDGKRSTLVGTGTEDYIGTGWGQGAYVHRFQGTPLADEATGRWTFYRFHIPDPIFFARDIEVSLQQIGGAQKKDVLELQQRGIRLIPVTLDPGSRRGFRQLLEGPNQIALTDPSLPDGWTNFYRSDDVSAVAYFYLERPENGLPLLASADARSAALRAPAAKR